LKFIILFQIFTTAVVGLFSFLLNIFLARKLSVSDFGVYQFFLTCGALYSLVQDLGFRTFIFRESTKPSPSVPYNIYEIFTFALGHLFLVTLLPIFLLILINQKLLAFSLLYFAFFVWSSWVSSYLKGQKKFYLEGCWHIFFRFSTFIMPVLFSFFFSLKVQAVFLLFALAGLFSFVLSFFFIPFLNKFLLSFSLFSIYRFTVPFLLVDVFTMIYFRSDIIMLKYFSSYTEIAHYSISYRIFEAFIFLLTPLIHIFFVYIREKFFIDKILCKNFLILSLFCAFFIGFFSFFFFYALSEKIILVFFSQHYLLSINILKILSLGFIFLLPNYIFTQSVIAFGREKLYILAAAFSAFFNILLNLYFIPLFGAKGAAFSTLLTEFFLFLFFTLTVKNGQIFKNYC